VVRNGFLDIAKEERLLRRTASAPADYLPPRPCREVEIDDTETDVDSHSISSLCDSQRTSSSKNDSKDTCAVASGDADLRQFQPDASLKRYNASWLPRTSWPALASAIDSAFDSDSSSDSDSESDSDSLLGGSSAVRQAMPGMMYQTPPTMPMAVSPLVSPAQRLVAASFAMPQWMLVPVLQPMPKPAAASPQSVGSPLLPQPAVEQQSTIRLEARKQPQRQGRHSPKLQPQLPPELQQLSSNLVKGSVGCDDAFCTDAPPSSLHAVTHAVNAASGVHRFTWTVDAGKLRSHERQAVSPSFQVPLHQKVTARLVMVPRPADHGKGSGSFRKSQGWGSLHLKCEATEGTIAFMLSITDGTGSYVKQPRGPVTHDFATHSTCSLPKDQEQWNFSKAVNKATRTFSLCLDILPCTASAQ